MRIWVDADACPVVIKEMLYRAAIRVQVSTTFVANTYLKLPPSPFIQLLTVPKGFDVADNRIVQELTAGDLVITADIPLAGLVIAKGGFALNPRGEFYSTANMAERLAMRNLMEELRSNGIETSGPSAFNLADRQLFASQLDRFLAKHHTLNT
ncbi:MAG: YaiI/YqxD family protein [Methylophilus sp.]|nr:YaiI/YqxD family protein [Methylophilus sp.]